MWSECVAVEIAEEFSVREGCLAWRKGLHLHVVVGGKFIKRDRKKRDRSAEWARMKGGGKLELHNLKRRVRRLKARIEQWTAEGKNICIGRDLDPVAWIEILTNPVSAVELEAFSDFCFFLLRCRGMRPDQVAGMLGTNVGEVQAAVAGRVQK